MSICYEPRSQPVRGPPFTEGLLLLQCPDIDSGCAGFSYCCRAVLEYRDGRTSGREKCWLSWPVPRPISRMDGKLMRPELLPVTPDYTQPTTSARHPQQPTNGIDKEKRLPPIFIPPPLTFEGETRGVGIKATTTTGGYLIELIPH